MERIVSGTKSVTTAGTREALSSSDTAAISLTIQAKRGNTNAVFVGGSTVASTNGISLTAGQTWEYTSAGREEAVLLSDVYIDATTNGEGITFNYVTRR